MLTELDNGAGVSAESEVEAVLDMTITGSPERGGEGTDDDHQGEEKVTETGKPATEPEQEETGGKTEAEKLLELPEEELEKLDPKVQAYIKQQRSQLEAALAGQTQIQDQAKKLETVVGRQSAEVAAARTAMESRSKEHEAGLAQDEKDFKMVHGRVLTEEQEASETYKRLKQDLADEVDPERRKDLQAQVDKAISDISYHRQNAAMLQQDFDKHITSVKSGHSSANEEAFLKAYDDPKESAANPYRAVQTLFDDFVKGLELDPHSVKANFKQMQRCYDLLVTSQRGRPENFERITKEIKTNDAARKEKLKKVSGPDGKGSSRIRYNEENNLMPKSMEGTGRGAL